MPYELFLALRYLRLRRGRHVAQVTALAATLGITVGVAALIVALALANGFRDELRDKILRGTAHITLMRTDGQPITEWRAVAEQLKSVAGVVDAHATTYEGAMLNGPENASYAVLRGIDAQSERNLTEIRRTLIEGSVEPLFRDAQADQSHVGGTATNDIRNDEEGSNEEPPAHAIIGADLAARIGLQRVGDEGWMITGEKTLEPPGFMTRSRRVRIAGIFRSGLYEYDSSWLYVSLATVGSMTGTPQAASVISIEVVDIYATEQIAERLRKTFGNRYTTVDWREANRPLFAALTLERRTLTVVIALIIIVAALNITATLVLVVIERRADIAILGAMGAHARSIMCIFVIEGAAIGAVGAFTGLALGLAACWVGNYFKVVRLPADVYSLSAIPFHPHVRDAVISALVAFVVSLLATIYPARAAARVRPAETLRYE